MSLSPTLPLSPSFSFPNQPKRCKTLNLEAFAERDLSDWLLLAELVKVYVMLAGLNDASINHDEVAAAAAAVSAATSQKATPEVAGKRQKESTAASHTQSTPA